MHNEERQGWLKEAGLACATGLLFGTTNTLVGHPFDTIKTKMQAQTTGGFMKGGGAMDCLRQVLKADGPKGLYRGVIPPMWGSAIYRSMQFTVYEGLYTKWEGHPTLTKSIPGSSGLQWRVLFAGLIAASSRAVVESPIECAKVLRQTGQTWHLNELYRGFGYQWARTGGLMTSYFIMIDTCKRKTNLFDSNWGKFVASGGSATIGFWLVWPFETLKNQAQAGTKGAGGTMMERIRYLTQTHGFMRGLFRGIVPGSLSVFLRNGAAMLVMNKAQSLLTEYGFR